MTLEEIIDTYCLAWSEEDDDARRRILDQTLLPEATYCDPTVSVSSTKALNEHISDVQANWPGSQVRRTSEIDLHHRMARFSWHLRKTDGTTLPEGLDIVMVDDSTGKLKSILGFFGPLKVI